MKYVAVSNIGKVKSNNEDSFTVGSKFWQGDIIKSGENENCFAVFDGVGGVDNGEIASIVAAKEFSIFFDGLHNIPPIEEVKKELLHTNGLIVEEGNMATTAVGIIYEKDNFLWFNMGDSRLYRMRNGLLFQFSVDDKTIAGSHVITSYLGSKYVDPSDINIGIIEQSVRLGDIFFLCSDGVSDMITDTQLEEFINSDYDIISIANNIKSFILQKTRAADNFTFIIMEVTNG
jgi:protein phosphatase